MGSKPVGISASRGAAVLGESDYQKVFEIWQRIREERAVKARRKRRK